MARCVSVAGHVLQRLEAMSDLDSGAAWLCPAARSHEGSSTVRRGRPNHLHTKRRTLDGTGETENSRTMQSLFSLASLAGGLMKVKGGAGWGSEEVALLVHVEMMGLHTVGREAWIGHYGAEKMVSGDCWMRAVVG